MNTTQVIKDAPRLVARALESGQLQRYHAPPASSAPIFVPTVKRHVILEINVGNGPVLIREEHAKRFAMSILESTDNCSPDIEGVWNSVCAVFGVGRAGLLSRNRTYHISSARHVLCYFMRACGMTLDEIGTALKRDHGTALNSLRATEKLKASPRYGPMIAEIERRLTQEPTQGIE